METPASKASSLVELVYTLDKNLEAVKGEKVEVTSKPESTIEKAESSSKKPEETSGKVEATEKKPESTGDKPEATSAKPSSAPAVDNLISPVSKEDDVSKAPIKLEDPKVESKTNDKKPSNKDSDDFLLNNPNIKTSISVIEVTNAPDASFTKVPTVANKVKNDKVQVVTPTPVLPTQTSAPETPAVTIEAITSTKPTRPTRSTRKRPSRLTMPTWVAKPTKPAGSDDEEDTEEKPGEVDDDTTVSAAPTKPARTTRTRRTRGTKAPYTKTTKATGPKFTTRTRLPRPSRLSFTRKPVSTAAPEPQEAVEGDEVEETEAEEA